MKVAIQRLPHGADLPLPAYATSGSAGLDLLSTEECVIAPGKRALVATGIAIALPAGLEAQVRPRSGLAIKSGITVLNAPGTIDCDYRGEVKVALINHSDTAFAISRGMKIAQLVVARYERVEWDETALPSSERGTGGFGSTGLHVEKT
ncbi:MAG: dUTP diphosphatase [Rhizomicrobium sp.]